MGVFVWFFIPETKGVSLERMDELFGVVQVAELKHNDPERVSVHEYGAGKRETTAEVENV